MIEQMRDIGERIKEQRLKKGLKQMELADIVGGGMCQSWVSQYESGSRVPSYTRIKQIAQALDIHVSYLI